MEDKLGKIKTWISHEGQTIEERDNPRAYFDLKIPNLHNSGINVVIIRMKDRDTVGITKDYVNPKKSLMFFQSSKKWIR